MAEKPLIVVTNDDGISSKGIKALIKVAGEFENRDLGEDTDLYALKKHYASIVPIHFDMTAYHLISEINNWDF